ncbi:MAG: hypothetical protein K8T26_14595 [Lentisphaerae bacterium]|nr:hypothetical protein [Lentisphaerota bacterium]
MTDPTHVSEPDTGGAPPPEPPPAGAADQGVTVLAPSAPLDSLPGRLQEEVVLQLRKLGDLREQEIKRHELAIAEMRDHVRRHTRASRLLLILSTGMLALIAVLALALHHVRADQARTVVALDATTAEVERIGGLVHDTAAQSKTQMDGLGAGLAGNVHKLDAIQLGLTATVNDSMQALRQERDAIFNGVRLAMEDQNHRLVEREIVLRDREQELQREMQRVREERQRIIKEAIDKLSTLSQEAPATKPGP